MKDKEISEIIGIPGSTIKEWKKATNYRKFLYELLKNMDKKELKKKYEAIREIHGLKRETEEENPEEKEQVPS